MGLKAWLEENPGLCLAALVALTGLAATIEAVSRRRLRRALRRLAAEWRMTYSACDRLRIAARIAHKLSVPGAADVCVTDVIYGSLGDRYRYIFTVEFTIGVVRGKQRHVRVAAFGEARDRQSPEQVGPLSLAPENLPLVEQYRRLAPATASAV